jgi:hypothetical protein
MTITKFQAPNKSQFTNHQTTSGDYHLDIGYYLIIGAWLLVIHGLQII